MSVPGSNLLNLAMGPIARQVMQWIQVTNGGTNAIGNYVAVQTDPVDITGSFQPIARKNYERLGLNLSNNYANVYLFVDANSADRGPRTSDVIVFAARWWQVQDAQDWLAVDGWQRVTCIEVPVGSV